MKNLKNIILIIIKYINTLINPYLYEDNYFHLHKELSRFYVNESDDIFYANFTSIKKYIKTENLNSTNDSKDNIIYCFKHFQN